MLGLIFVTFLTSVNVWAQSNSAVLPVNIWHPSLRSGIISEVSSRYDNEGSLQSIGRLNQSFTGDSIKNYSTEFQQLSNFLRTTYPNSNYADAISLGNLEFETDATVTYFAPVLARGITKKLTLGVGVPIVTLDASVQAKQTGVNNSKQIRDQIASDLGALNPTAEQGFTRMANTNLVEEFNKALRDRGYEVPKSKRETVVGDVQIASIYQYYSSKKWTLYQQTTLNLPTGPEDDPDDFLDIPIFKQTWIKLAFHQDYALTRRWTLGTLGGYTFKAPDTAEKRVPENEKDLLPKEERKERVNRNLGDIINAGVTTNYWLTNYFNVGTGYEYSYKQQDYYSGGRGYDYSLLSRNTEGSWHRVQFVSTLSTVNWYFRKKFAAPLMVTYTYSDIVAGVNVDRQMTHELALKMFF